ncbi:hypothetical protein FRC02_006584, partial [Tulasnella sp. 418]
MSNISLTESTVLAALDYLMKNVQVPDAGETGKQGLVESIGDSINRMALVTEAFRTVATNQLKLNRRRRNTVLSPIFRFPDEVLVLIFEFLLASSTAAYQIEDIRLVCYRWYHVVESNHILWSYIYINHKSKPQKIRAQVAKSQATPLVIKMEKPTSTENEILNILFDHIPRWQTVTLDLAKKQEWIG